MTIEVLINGQGPFRFVVDTGAGRSVLTPAIVEKLALPPGPDMIIHGIAGSVVRTRSSFCAASSDPSATTTIPACWE